MILRLVGFRTVNLNDGIRGICVLDLHGGVFLDLGRGRSAISGMRAREGGADGWAPEKWQEYQCRRRLPDLRMWVNPVSTPCETLDTRHPLAKLLGMTGNESISFFADSLGWLRGTVERHLRDMREKGLLRTGRRGGGRGTVHYDASDFAAIVLGFGAPQPSDAAEAYEKLSGLRLVEQTTINRKAGRGRQADISGKTTDYRGLQGERLINWVTRQVVAMQAPDVAARWSAEVGSAWKLTLCMEPASAVVTWIEADGTVYTDTFGPPQPALPSINGLPSRARRLTELPFQVLVTAGRLAADTAARQQTSGPLTPELPRLSGSEADEPSLGKESAAPGRAALPRPRLADAIRQSDVSYIGLERGIVQAPIESVKRGQSTLIGIDHYAADRCSIS